MSTSVSIHVQGDGCWPDIPDLQAQLTWLHASTENLSITTGVSGGYSSGSIYELTEDFEITHDVYFEQVQEYLRTKGNGHG